MKNILMIGCGKMGEALLNYWQKTDNNFRIIDPAIPKYFTSFEDATSDGFSPNIIIFAVKPQILADILPKYANINVLYISIAAGKKIEFYQQYLGSDAHVIRAMPNIPAMVGEGVSALIASDIVSEKEKNFTEKLFSQVGLVFYLTNENKMDSVTAISGSAPAYVFYFIESLKNAAIKVGFTEDLAIKIVNQVVYGSAKLAINSDINISELRQNVTSKAGTTQAALEVLMGGDFANIIDETIMAAYKKSCEMSE